MVDTIEFDVQLDVRGELVEALSLDQIVNVEVNQKTIQGVIVSLQPDPDINTNTHEIRIRVPNENIRAGALATVMLPLSLQEQAQMIPVTSVLNLHGNTYVYMLEGDRVRKTPVSIGKRVDDEYILLSGLNAGQKIVARDVLSLSDQQLVAAP